MPENVSTVLIEDLRQYTLIQFRELRAETGIPSSVSAIGCSYGNAPAETIDGLYRRS
jgi:putative transposase